jgi:hypothetical protein
MRFFWERLIYMWRHSRLVIVIVVTLTAVGFYISKFQTLLLCDNMLANLYNNLAGPLIALATLGIATIVTLSENRESWEASLPKQLTVNFDFGDKRVLRCEDAYLSSESDIRAWGQQLGMQMNDNIPLKFQPNILVSARIINSDPGPGIIKAYEATFSLTEIPKSVSQNTERSEAFGKGWSLIWNKNNNFKDEWKHYKIG